MAMKFFLRIFGIITRAPPGFGVSSPRVNLELIETLSSLMESVRRPVSWRTDVRRGCAEMGATEDGPRIGEPRRMHAGDVAGECLDRMWRMYNFANVTHRRSRALPLARIDPQSKLSGNGASRPVPMPAPPQNCYAIRFRPNPRR